MKKILLNKKRTISYILFAIAIVSLVLFVLTIRQIKSCQLGDQKFETFNECYDYLSKNSNLFKVLERSPEIWPEQTLILDLKKQCVLYINKTDTAQVNYENVKNHLECKKIKNNDTINFEKILNAGSLDSLLMSGEYDSQINKYTQNNPNSFTKNDSLFSKLYIALAGDTLGHIIVGIKGKQWHPYRIKDFPQHVCTTDPTFYKNLIENHNIYPKKSLKTYLEEHKIIEPTNMFVVYYDFIHKHVIEKNDKIDTATCIQHDIRNLQYYSGWLNYSSVNPPKWELMEAQDYYQNRNTYFVNVSEDWIEKVEWTDRKPLPIWLVVLWGLLAIILAGIGGGLLALNNKTIVKEDTPIPTPTNTTKENPKQIAEEHNEDAIAEKKIAELTKQIESLQEKIELLTQEKKTEFDNNNKYIESLIADNKALNDKMEEIKKRHSAEIIQAEKDAVDQYKKNHKIEDILDKAEQWDDLLKITKSDKLLQRLDEIRKIAQNFPTVETIRETYKKALLYNKENDFRAQMLFVFGEIRKQTSKDLDWENKFKDLCDKADYANNVHDRFEAVKKQMEVLKQNKALSSVINKESLDFLDRIAFCVWSINAMNDLFAAFKLNSLPKKTIDKAKDNIVSNLLQLLVARVFMNDFSKEQSVDTFVQDRQDELTKRIAKLEKDYGITFTLDDSFNDTNKAFDEAIDQIRGTDEFVNRMWKHFVEEFYSKADTNTNKAWFFEQMVAMGYHTVDFVRRKRGIAKALCPNYNYLLSGFDTKNLPSDAAFAYQDYAHSVDYTNRVYEWLTELNVKQLKALVGRQLILP